MIPTLLQLPTRLCALAVRLELVEILASAAVAYTMATMQPTDQV